MTETEALKRFIPILGRISTPGERATITRNILERIAGQQTSVMGVSHKHAGALAWPNDHVKALEFERALDMAVDSGEFVSFIHRTDRRHFQIEELSAWPNCPKVDTESPLTFWLSDTAQTAATPAPVVEAPASEPKAKRKSAFNEVLAYLQTVHRNGKFKTTGDFIRELGKQSGEVDSPFKKATRTDETFYLKSGGDSVSHSVISDRMKSIR